MKHQFAYAAALAGLMAAVAATPAMAATTLPPVTFNVTIKITGTCTAITTGTAQSASIASDTYTGQGADIDFGSNTATYGAAALTQGNAGGFSNGVKVTCSKNTPFTVGMVSANKSTSTTGAGSMKGITTPTNTDTIDYQLYQPTITGSGLSASVSTDSTPSGNVWGSDATHVLSFTGQGLASPISFPVFATIPAGSLDKFVDRYQDQVTVTLTY